MDDLEDVGVNVVKENKQAGVRTPSQKKGGGGREFCVNVMQEDLIEESTDVKAACDGLICASGDQRQMEVEKEEERSARPL